MEKIFVSGQSRWKGRGWGAWAVSFPGRKGRYIMSTKKISRKPAGAPERLEREAVIHALETMAETDDVTIVTLNRYLQNLVSHPNKALTAALKRHGRVSVLRVPLADIPRPLAFTRKRAITLAEIDDDQFKYMRAMDRRRLRKSTKETEQKTQCPSENEEP